MLIKKNIKQVIRIGQLLIHVSSLNWVIYEQQIELPVGLQSIVLLTVLKILHKIIILCAGMGALHKIKFWLLEVIVLKRKS